MAASAHSVVDFCPASLSNRDGKCASLLVCEHASNLIPPRFAKLGLASELLDSHIAWDPGAAEVAKFLSELLDAPLVKGEVSRLLYDCNRPPEAKDAIPAKSEIYEIPGNVDISAEDREYRINNIYSPFSRSLESAATSANSLITIHSFNPTYRGIKRDVEIGILHDSDSDFADLILETAPSRTSLKVRRNEPYGPGDGVMHTLQLHGIENGIPNVMLEIRNDLIMTKQDCQEIAELLFDLIQHALNRLREMGRIEEARQ